MLPKQIENIPPAKSRKSFTGCSHLTFSGTYLKRETKQQREKFARQYFASVKPEHTLQVVDTFQYVPILRVLQKLASSENFWTDLNNDISTRLVQSGLRTICDGSVYREKLSVLLPNGAQCTLFLVVFSDESEIINTLGAKRGVHKIIVYFSVLNTHAEYRTKISAVHLAQVAPYRLVKEKWR